MTHIICHFGSIEVKERQSNVFILCPVEEFKLCFWWSGLFIILKGPTAKNRMDEMYKTFTQKKRILTKGKNSPLRPISAVHLQCLGQPILSQ